MKDRGTGMENRREWIRITVVNETYLCGLVPVLFVLCFSEGEAYLQ